MRNKCASYGILAAIFTGMFYFITKDSNIETAITTYVAGFMIAVALKVAVELILED